MKAFKLALLTSVLMLSAPVFAGAIIDLSAEASRPASNDMVRVSVYREASGENPAELAQQVNQEVSAALRVIKLKSGVTVKTGQQSTYPVYGKDRKINAWRMRSELIIESKDLSAVSTLLGELQQMQMAVGHVNQMPSPETRRKVEDATTGDAIKAFQARAAVVAEQLGKRWKIKQLNIQHGTHFPQPLMRSVSAGTMAESAMPAPLEAGESQLTTNIHGQIELAD